MTSNTVNLLVVVVVYGRQAEDLMQGLNRENIYFTKFESSEMVFQERIYCLMIGLNNARLSNLMGLVEHYCQPREEYVPVQLNLPANFPPMPMIEARVGGALVYVVEIERFEQF